MPGLFDEKIFNAEVFGGYVDRVPNLNRNELLKSGAIVEAPKYAAMLPEQTGGNYIVVPIKGRIGGTPNNYDGSTDITTDSRDTFAHGRIVIGRAHGWTEKDFSTDITGEDFEPAAGEVAEYWDDVDQNTLLLTMQGIFSMTGAKNLEFVNGHTYDISEKLNDNKFDETTLNNGIQKALGDNKSKFSLAIMHSQVATNLENLNLLEYLKYTDTNGVTRNLAIGTVNGRTVLIDDNMPVVEVPESTSGAGDGYLKYTTYVFGQGAIEYTNVGVKKPYEIERNALKNGGEDTLVSRQRKIFSPWGISFKKPSFMSPTDAQLSNGANWELANNEQSGNKLEVYPIKAIPIARIITRG